MDEPVWFRWWKSLVGPQSVRTAAVVGWVSRGVLAVSQIGAIRILTSNLGVSGYAGYAVILGLQFWFNLSEFGFGASLQNRLTRLRLRGNSGEITFAIVVLFLLATGCLLCLAVVATSFFAGPLLLRNFPEITRQEATAGFAVYGVLTVMAIVCGLVYRVFYAERRAHLAYLSTAAGGLLGFVGLCTLPLFHLERPFVPAMLLYLGPGVVMLFVLLGLKLYPVLRRADVVSHIRRSWRHVIGYLWQQARHVVFVTLISGLVLSSDYIILSQFASPSQIAVYAIVNRFFVFVMTLFTSVTTASWPLTSEAIATGDVAKLRKAVLDCLMIGFALVTMCSIVLAVGRDVVVMILSPKHAMFIPLALLGACWLYWCVRVWTDTSFVVLQSGNRADLVSAVAAVQAVASVTFAMLGAKYYGATGMLCGMVLSFILTVSWYLPMAAYREFVVGRNNVTLQPAGRRQ